MVGSTALVLACLLIAVGMMAIAIMHSNSSLEAARNLAADRVHIAILSCEADQSEAALRLAEKTGLPDSKRQYLRALHLVADQQLQQAHAHLEEARKTEPHDPTILALFATTTLANFGWGAYEKLLPELASADPKTPEAKLFVGYALFPANHERSVALMEDAVEEDGSPLARVLLANTRMRSALETHNIKLMKQALDDLAGASAWNPRAIRVMVAAAEIHSAASKLYRQAGDTQGEERHINLATHAIHQLEQFHPRNPRALRARLEFLIEQGRTDTALDLARRALREFPGQRLEEVTAHLLGLSGHYREAMVLARSFKSDSIMRAVHFLAAIEVSDGLDEARASAAEISRETPTHINAVFTGVLLNLVLGETNQSSRLARGFLANQGIIARTAMPQPALRVIRYLAGELNEEDLLKAATPGHDLALSHHFVGLRQLARGDRATAKSHFERSMDGIPVLSPAREISKHILGRMAADRNWPPTIPTNSQGEVAPVGSPDAADPILACYDFLQSIGKGGRDTVCVAEQAEAVRRRHPSNSWKPARTPQRAPLI